eukprot:gene32322-16893_t
MPTEPELLMDAQNWVAKWPEAVGHTAMLSAFSMADNYWNADCWYLMSDGLADDPSQCLEFIQSRIRNNERVPVIHAVGFFPHNVNDNFEGRRYLKELAALTGGSFQEYDKHLQRIYQEGVGFVNLDPRTVHPADVPEREWVEAQLKAERKRNLRLGIFERLEVTMTRIQVGDDDVYMREAEGMGWGGGREGGVAQLKAERKKNLRLGIFEHLEVTMTRIQ